MKALGTASHGPQANDTVTHASPGKRTQVEAQYGSALPRLSLGQGSPAPEAFGAPVPVDAQRSAPRPPDEAADLALDCIGAITTTESGGKANESFLHTASGVSASYANVAQQITSKTIGILDGFDSEELAELDLDKKDLKEAHRVCWAVRTIWNAAVGDRTATTLDELRQKVDPKAIKRSRLTDADLELMLRGGEFFALVREGRHELAAMKANTKQEKANKKEERARIAGEVAETEIAQDLKMRETDISVYLSKGSGEDLAAWMRVAVERPPVDGEDDGLGQRIKAAAEAEDGWRMARIDIEGAVESHLQKQPLDSDLGALFAAIQHHSQGAADSYKEKVTRHFKELRADRASGRGWSPPNVDPGTDPAPAHTDPDSDPVAAAMELDLDWLMATATAFDKLSLDGSVGAGGTNSAPDVRRVVIRLQFLGRLGLTVDQSSLAAAIQQLQRDAAGMKNGDGRIDPGGKTLKALNARMTGIMTDPTTDGPAVTPDAPTPTPTTDVPAVTPDAPTPTPTPDAPTPTPDTPTPHAPTPTPASKGLSITASVGAGGANIPTDVTVVRARLEELGYASGSSDDELANAIRAFQSRATHHKISKCDGRVDPGGRTAQALASGAAAAPIVDHDPTALVVASNDPEVVMLRLAIDQLAAAEAAVAEEKNEETGTARDELVTRIADTRQMVESMPLIALSPDDAAAVRAWAHRRLNQMSPYYSQGRNADFLETKSNTRTCNLTSLAMALEALGKSSADYQGSLDTIRAIRTSPGSKGQYNYKKAFDQAKGEVSDDLSGLRLPDFLQLAAVGHYMDAGAEMKAAVKRAWLSILVPETLADLANAFGANAWVRSGGAGGSTYEDFQQAFGTELDRGHQIVLLLPHHYVRLEAVTQDGLILDDPGRHYKKDRAMPFKEAKGSIYRAIIIA